MLGYMPAEWRPPQAKIHSTGSQVEADFKVAEAIEDDEVPSIFRQHRHAFSSKPTDRDAFLRQIKYRSGHIGTKELEILLMDWLTLNGDEMTYEELEGFDNDILDMENPTLQRYFIEGRPLLPEDEDNKYLKIIIDYVAARKEDYYANVP